MRKKTIKQAFLFACYTGLRLSDIRTLTWGQIREGKLFFKQKKTKSVEYLPLNQTALEILYSDNEEKVIPLPESKVFNIGKKLSDRIGDDLRDWAKEAGINKYITFHTTILICTMSLNQNMRGS